MLPQSIGGSGYGVTSQTWTIVSSGCYTSGSFPTITHPTTVQFVQTVSLQQPYLGPETTWLSCRHGICLRKEYNAWPSQGLRKSSQAQRRLVVLWAMLSEVTNTQSLPEHGNINICTRAFMEALGVGYADFMASRPWMRLWKKKVITWGYLTLDLFTESHAHSKHHVFW